MSTRVSYSRRFEKQLEKCPENIQQKANCLDRGH
jgi:mRNA-degrading endonuclease RelE of RelBE toxin-antitoxin system